MVDLLTKTGIEESHRRIGNAIHLTPILSSSAINALLGVEVIFKCENFQKIGAFKIRGASNAAALLSPEERARGLATHSSGNHAQAVAMAARLAGVPAYIVMPSNSPRVKRAAVRGYGARITESGPRIEDRESTMREVLTEVNASFIHPYDDERVIAGQATAAKELFAQCPECPVVFGPVGGGGLMSGTCLAARSFSPGTVVYGAEPIGADDAARSLAAGHRITNTVVDTIADGLRTNLSDRTFDILRRHLEEIITVSDDEIGSALRLIYERLKIVVEPSSAVPLAALIRERHRFAGKRVGIILSGGNVDLDRIDLSIWKSPEFD
jgi:threonine dehydratase